MNIVILCRKATNLAHVPPNTTYHGVKLSVPGLLPLPRNTHQWTSVMVLAPGRNVKSSAMLWTEIAEMEVAESCPKPQINTLIKDQPWSCPRMQKAGDAGSTHSPHIASPPCPDFTEVVAISTILNDARTQTHVSASVPEAGASISALFDRRQSITEIRHNFQSYFANAMKPRQLPSGV